MKIKDHISFNEEWHLYTNEITKEKYKSVTKFIEGFKVPFEGSSKQTYNTGKKYNISHEEVLELWKKQNEESKARGTWIHNRIEMILKDIKPPAFGESNISWHYEVPVELIKDIKKMRCKKHIEAILYNDDLKLAGQSDLVLEYKNHIEIWDWKTNAKSIEKMKASYNNFLFPFNELPQCSWIEYHIQLIIYAIFAEQMYKKPCKNLYLVHIYQGTEVYKLDNELVNELKKLIKSYFRAEDLYTKLKFE